MGRAGKAAPGIVCCAFGAALAFLSVSCASSMPAGEKVRAEGRSGTQEAPAEQDAGSGETAAGAEDGMDDIRLPLGRGSGKPEYSPNTLLISLEEGVTDEQVYALAAKYDMEILYLYQNFNMCAAKLPRAYSDAEFKVLLRKLNKEPEVLEASRDAIMHLYD